MKEKLLCIFILEIMQEYSSDVHKMYNKEILKKLKERYNVIISRNTLSSYLKELKEHGLVSGERGVYINRKFSKQDINSIVSGLTFSKFVTQIDVKRIMNKLKTISDVDTKKYIDRMVSKINVNRTNNSNIYSIIETIYEAISKEKKLEIVSYKYDIYGVGSKGKIYIVDPYHIIAEKGWLYLICYAGRGDVEPRRIDRLVSARVVDEKRIDINKIEKYANGNFDINQYIKEHVYMYSGECMRVSIKILKNRISEYIDWFGRPERIISETEEYVTVKVKACINAIYFWALQYSSIAEIVEPKELRSKLYDGAAAIKEMYSKH